MKIILASGSPRRKELLNQVGIDFDVYPADIDETCENTDPASLVMELSEKKALAVKKHFTNQVILAADTVVAYLGNILGKPKNEKEAFNMLKSLSGKEHEVYTGVTIIDKNGRVDTFFSCTKVKMFESSDEEIWTYVSTGECMDKAGAYGIQGKGAVLVESIDGDYNNVVGLPVSTVFRKLQKLV